MGLKISLTRENTRCGGHTNRTRHVFHNKVKEHYYTVEVMGTRWPLGKVISMWILQNEENSERIKKNDRTLNVSRWCYYINYTIPRLINICSSPPPQWMMRSWWCKPRIIRGLMHCITRIYFIFSCFYPVTNIISNSYDSSTSIVNASKVGHNNNKKNTMMYLCKYKSIWSRCVWLHDRTLSARVST